MRFFWQKTEIFEVGKIRKYDEGVFFEKKVFISLKAFLQKKKAGKYAGGSWPFDVISDGPIIFACEISHSVCVLSALLLLHSVSSW